MQSLKYQSEFLPEVEIYVLFSDHPRYKELIPIFDNYGFGFMSPSQNIVIIDGEKILELGLNSLKFIEAHEISHVLMNHDGPRDEEDEIDADLGAYILLKNAGKSTDEVVENFYERHGIEFSEDLLKRVSSFFKVTN